MPDRALPVPNRQVDPELRVDRVRTLVVRGLDEAEADVLCEHRTSGQDAIVLVEVHLAVLGGAVIIEVHVDDVLHLVGHLARPMDLVLSNVDVLPHRRRPPRRKLEDALVVAEHGHAGQFELVESSRARAPLPAAFDPLDVLIVELEAREHGALDRLPARADQLRDSSDEPVVDHLAIDDGGEQRVEYVLVLGVARARRAQVASNEVDQVLDASHSELGVGIVVKVDLVERADLGQLQELTEHLLRVGCAARRREELVGDRLRLLGSVRRGDCLTLLRDALLQQVLRLQSLVAGAKARRLSQICLRLCARLGLECWTSDGAGRCLLAGCRGRRHRRGRR